MPLMLFLPLSFKVGQVAGNLGYLGHQLDHGPAAEPVDSCHTLYQRAELAAAGRGFRLGHGPSIGGMATDKSWAFPKPTGLESYDVSDTGYRIRWSPVKGPGGQQPESYTVATFQLNGVKVDEFVAHSTSTAEYGQGGKGLHPGWAYRTEVWANGGPVAPEHATVQTTLHQAPAATVVPMPPPPGQPAPTPPGQQPAPTAATVTAARTDTAATVAHPATWAPWDQVVSHAQSRMRVELQHALSVYDRETTAAGKILDTAVAIATDIAGHLEAEAWAAWQAGMDTAAKASQAILGPAEQAYGAAITRASAAFNQAITTAQAAYNTEVADANKAQAIGRSVTPAA